MLHSRSERPQRRGRDSSQRASVVSAGDEMDSALDIQYAIKILNRLIRSKHSWPFLEPVDPVALELEDYFEVPSNSKSFVYFCELYLLMAGKSRECASQIITSPMDLGK